MDEVFASNLYNSSKFLDQAFERYVQDFMRQNMPGFPLDLLSQDCDMWELLPRLWCRVRKMNFTQYECCGCSMVVRQESCLPTPAFTCSCPQDEKEWATDIEELFFVYDSNHNEYLSDVRGADHDEVLDGLPVSAWDYEADAKEAAREHDIEHNQSDGYGFPWANSWAFMPEDRITDEMLEEAGFRVGNYFPRRGDSYRLCGIDGGGYSFILHHWAPLAVIVAESYQWPVDTDQGRRLVTRDERTTLEKMASVQQDTEK